MTELTRMAVNITAETRDALAHLAAQENVTVTEAVRSLTSIGDLVYRAIHDGHDVLIRYQDGKTSQVLLIPPKPE